MALDTETRNQLIETVRRFVRERLVPIEAQVAANDEVPAEIVQEMRELGLFGLSIPEEYGGLGLTMEEEVLVCLELGQTSPAFRSVIGTTVGIGSQGIVMFGNDEQKAEWLPKLASGEAISSFCLTEPEAGSDAASVRTTAIADGNEYVLNGTKRYITNANRASVLTVMARSDPGTPGAKGISSFVIPVDTPGITISKPEGKMGQAGAHICDVVFDDCRVPRSCLLGEEGQGFKVAMQVLDRGRVHIAAVCTGVAERLIRESVQYAREREQFGQAIGEFQLIQAMLADSQTECFAARSMIMETARQYDEGGSSVSMNASSCKLFASEMVGRVADRAVQVFGGAGYVTDYGIERFYRDVRIFRLYEGTSQIQQIVIARNLLRNLEV
jgi:acyl-CoA dehydrogenase